MAVATASMAAAWRWARPSSRRPATAFRIPRWWSAAPEGYRRAFVEGGTPVRLLLADHLHRDSAHHLLVGSLLERLRMATPPEGGAALAKAAAPPPLVAPLSEREQVVLRYLSSRLSAGEIADELRAVGLRQHREDPHQEHLPQARHQPALGRGQARPPAPAAVTHTAGRSGGSRSRLRPSPRRSKAANSSVKP